MIAASSSMRWLLAAGAARWRRLPLLAAGCDAAGGRRPRPPDGLRLK
jgi:hypothetical protein